MEAGWESARALLAYPELADLLGERHRIIAADRQNASAMELVSAMLVRSLEILDRVDLAPGPLRADLRAGATAPAYLYAASEVIDAAADLIARSAVLVHENERRWRVFRAGVARIVR